MDKTLLDLLHQVTVIDLVTAFVLVSTVVVALMTQKKKIVKVLNKWRKTKNEEEDFKQLVYTLRDTVQSLAESVSTYEGHREHDRADSRRIQKEINEAISIQSEGINELKHLYLEMEERNSKTKRAEMKEKIERIYRECSPSQTCTDTQYETLRDLIDEYEEHGGSNSFVHSLVEKEMVHWKIISAIPESNSY